MDLVAIAFEIGWKEAARAQRCFEQWRLKQCSTPWAIATVLPMTIAVILCRKLIGRTTGTRPTKYSRGTH